VLCVGFTSRRHLDNLTHIDNMYCAISVLKQIHQIGGRINFEDQQTQKLYNKHIAELTVTDDQSDNETDRIDTDIDIDVDVDVDIDVDYNA